MKKVSILFSLCVLIFACQQKESAEKNESIDSTAIIEKGKYLVTISGCNDCHSPKMMTDKGPVPNPDLLLSGHPSNLALSNSDTSTSNHWILFHMDGTAAKGPWGTSFAGNLTPHETGIGNWSEEQFANALRLGYYKGMKNTRMLLPLMPWQNYTGMSNEDVHAIFMYLKSIPAINNVVPAPIPPGS
jgi:hypothetical protein